MNQLETITIIIVNLPFNTSSIIAKGLFHKAYYYQFILIFYK